MTFANILRSFPSKTLLIYVLVISSCIVVNCAQCPFENFELITGHVYSASAAETIATVPETLQLTDCLERCRNETECRSINFETGLCVLFNSSVASVNSMTESGLRPSSFPVFTIYAQKVCITNETYAKCGQKPWTFERVLGYELRGQTKKTVTVADR